MPMQWSFATSLGMHNLFFGTEVAFEHYGGMLFSGPGFIMVDLVAEGGHGGPRSGVRKLDCRKANKRVDPVPAVPVLRAREMPLPSLEPHDMSNAAAARAASGVALNEVQADADGTAGSPGC